MSDQDEAARCITRLQFSADLNAAPAKAAAGDHNKCDEDFQAFVRQALIQNKQSLEGMVENGTRYWPIKKFLKPDWQN